MSRETIILCDICGVNKNDVPEHWSSSVQGLNLEFKHFGNIQQNINIGDCCMSCAKKLFTGINLKISEMQKIGSSNNQRKH